MIPSPPRSPTASCYGRGAADMKSALAAFAAAAAQVTAKGPVKGSISLLITGDEEGPAVNGTAKVLAWLKQKGERIDHCVVGEPTSTVTRRRHAEDRPPRLDQFPGDGQGRAGPCRLSAQGEKSHPAAGRNWCSRFPPQDLDTGSSHFDPSTLSFTSVDVGNPAANVIPAEAHAAFNIRFNDAHTPESLIALGPGPCGPYQPQERLRDRHPPFGERRILPDQARRLHRTGERQRSPSVTGEAPLFSTSGGTSDARFIKDICPVVELGLAGATMHKTDECVPVSEITRLTEIYAAVLADYFAKAPL